MQPQILLLKEGTENAHGKQQVISNINACAAIVDAVRTTLGPRGMDKLIVDNRVRFCSPICAHFISIFPGQGHYK